MILWLKTKILHLLPIFYPIFACVDLNPDSEYISGTSALYYSYPLENTKLGELVKGTDTGTYRSFCKIDHLWFSP